LQQRYKRFKVNDIQIFSGNKICSTRERADYIYPGFYWQREKLHVIFIRETGNNADRLVTQQGTPLFVPQ
jgi:hypothetical protein